MFVLTGQQQVSERDEREELLAVEHALAQTVQRYKQHLNAYRDQPLKENRHAIASEVTQAFASNHAQSISCDQCGEEIPLNKFRKHKDTCEMKEVCCPLPGCSATVAQGMIKHHFKTECKVYRKRQLLAQKRQQDRPSTSMTQSTLHSLRNRGPPPDVDNSVVDPPNQQPDLSDAQPSTTTPEAEADNNQVGAEGEEEAARPSTADRKSVV